MIEINNLNVAYQDKVVFDDLSFKINENEITSILGESGIGKTTLLNCIAGLINYRGEIKKDFEKISYVFQNDRLIKNLNVEQNLKLVCGNVNAKEILESVGLYGVEKLYPKDLSAGMKRRVAIVRAFTYPSELLLMDEPFINLDISIKVSLIEMVKKLKEKDNKTIVFVTHDIKEAVLLADRIIIIKDKKIKRDIRDIDGDTESEIYNFFTSSI